MTSQIFSCETVGDPTTEVVGDGREEKSEEKRILEPKMSDDHSDSEDSVDTTGYREVELHLPLEIDMDPDRPHEDIRTHSFPRARLISVRRSSVVLSPQTGPNRNGQDMGCHCLSIRNHVDSRLGLQCT